MTDINPNRVNAGVREGGQYKTKHRNAILTIEASQRWQSVGFSDEEALEWRTLGLSPAEASRFADSGIDVDDAEAWLDSGLSLDEACVYASNGLSIREAKAWKETTFTSTQVLALREQGYGPREAQNLADFGSLLIPPDMSEPEIKKANEFGLSIDDYTQNGVPFDESTLEEDGEDEWENSGFSRSEASDWLANGFTLGDASRWTEAGIEVLSAYTWATIETPNGAHAWIRNGFTFREAYEWKEKAFNLEDAITFRYMGIQSAEEAQTKILRSDYNALFGNLKLNLRSWTMHGFTEEERDAFLDLGIKTPQEAKEYRAKYDTK
jgi:hypothetical protein